jgi:menaquinone-9 beta-reductase
MKAADLVVIGGGPAGTAAAIMAARSGAHVMLLEAGRFPRHKVCGEFVSPESLELLSRLLDAGHKSLLNDAVRIEQARLFIDGHEVPSEIRPAAASIPRFDLDAALWDSAKRVGVEASEQVRVQEIRGTGPFVVRTSIGEMEARAVVNGSGRWSNLHQTPIVKNPAGEKWIGLKAHYAEASPSRSVDLYFFPGGYCGVQPVDAARVNACAMVRADVARSLPDVFKLHPALRERSRQWRMVSEPVSVAPLRFETPQPLQGGVFLAGDAAAFVDPFIGDGISLALRSGALAAECLAGFFAGRMSHEDAARQYDQAYRQGFASIFRSSSRLRRMLLLPRVVRAPMVFMLQRNPAIARYLVKQTR